MSDLPRTLFVGFTTPPLAWYRMIGPAQILGLDYITYHGPPPHTIVTAASVGGKFCKPDLADYEVVIIQQPEKQEWALEIEKLQDLGVRVLIDIDDDIYGPAELESHISQDAFGEDRIAGYKECLSIADGIVCTNQHLADLYGSWGPPTHVCRNGIDIERFKFTRPERETTIIGWSGASGHGEALAAWLPAVEAVMADRPDVRWISLGEFYFMDLAKKFPDRVMGLPYMNLEQHGAAYTNLDIAIAPAGRGAWYKGKSDLRWLEASAAHVATVCDPFVYTDVIDGETGLLAETSEDVYRALIRLVDDNDLCVNIADAAHDYVTEYRSMSRLAEDWRNVLTTTLVTA